MSTSRSTKNMATRTLRRYAYTTKRHHADVTTCFANLVCELVAYFCVAYACVLPGVSAHGDMASALTGTATAIPESPWNLEPSLAMLVWLFGDGVQSPMKERPRLTRSA